MKRHDVILNMINDSFIFSSDYCDHSDVYIHKNVDFNTQTNVKSQINFKKINFISSSINIMKRKTFSFSSIENEEKEEMKNDLREKKKKMKKMKKKSDSNFEN